jgi:hypothetical protein
MKNRSGTNHLTNRPVFLWAALTGIVLVWFAPITLFGRMPVGGDVTSFFLPLMAYYRAALEHGRVPLWNELWGYGFPMLAESQAGVFYPAHLLLYGLFKLETAYSLNIVLHHLLAGWFTYFCGRTFGLRPIGAMLAGLVFAGNGFFIIHFPHQWAYTSGCWVPLAVALAWRVVAPSEAAIVSRVSSVIGLAVVLAVQMLAGHFQIAFYTQMTVLLMGVACIFQQMWCVVRSSRGKLELGKHSRWGPSGGVFWIIGAVCVAFGVAAVQLLPTYELIQLALPQGRDFEYLSGFANAPFHLVSYVLPTLFHVNPLWRAVAWDPFHTSPEECFSYVGILPICLAAGASWRWRREPRVRLWVLLALVTLLLSLGPYVPWFRGLICLPGFSGFRSSARWSVTTALFLSLLAGRALDGVRAVERLRFWLRSFVIGFILVIGLSGAWCWMMVSAKPGGSIWSATAFDWMSRAWAFVSPWEDRDGLWRAAIDAHEPARDPWSTPRLAGLGYRVVPRPGEPITSGPHGLPARAFTLANEFRNVMLQELVPPVLLLGVILGCVYFGPWHRRTPRSLLVGLVVMDLGAATWLRPTEFIPRGSLVTRGPLLSRLHDSARGQRVALDQNLPMLVGAAAENAYRTVDIQFSTQWYDPASSVDRWGWYNQVLNRSDSAWQVFESQSPSFGPPPQDGDEDELIVDPVVAGIMHGFKFVEQCGPPASVFRLRRRDPTKRANAWYWDASENSDQFERLFDTNERQGRKASDQTMFWLYRSPAKPVTQVRSEPESKEYALDCTGPGMLILSELAYPGWEAKVKWPDGRTAPAETLVSQAGCLMVRITKPGKYHIELNYRSRPFEQGLLISSLSTGFCVLSLVLIGPLRRRLSSAK